MLNTFKIQNFRQFKNLELSQLRQVNLIVGQNNVGKSSFLEALEVYATHGSPITLLKLVKNRQEDWLSEATRLSRGLTHHVVRHLFLNHKIPDLAETGIILGEIDSSHSLHLHLAAYQRQETEGMSKLVPINSNQIDEGIPEVELFLVAEQASQTRLLFQLNQDDPMSHTASQVFYNSKFYNFNLKNQVVSTTHLPTRQLAALWDLTSLTDLEADVIETLRLIDDRVSGVAFVEDINRDTTDPENRIPLVKLRGIAEPLPLKSLGEGMYRLFCITVALVNSEAGLLLIDEFENGLHWTVQPKVWQVVFQLAERLEVQVFATTHSRDCVDGFEQAWSRHPQQGTFFRLEGHGTEIKATEYPLETLSDAIEMDVEIR